MMSTATLFSHSWGPEHSLASYHCGPDLTKSLIFCLRGTAEPEDTGTPVTGMCAVPCATETVAKASAQTEACNNMMRFDLNECVGTNAWSRRKEKKNERKL